MLRSLASPPLIAALAACGSPASDNVMAAATPSNAADAAIIRKLPAGQRDAVFLRAVRDSGADCQRITQAGEQQLTGGPPTWAVMCDGTGRYLVSIDQGVATVTAAAALPAG